MAILADKNSRVMVQGITGGAGSFHAKRMIAYGTNIVGGTSPGKGGAVVDEGHAGRSVRRFRAEQNGLHDAIAGEAGGGIEHAGIGAFGKYDGFLARPGPVEKPCHKPRRRFGGACHLPES